MTTPKNMTGLKLDPKRKALWLDALRNQNYKQGQGQLLIEAGDLGDMDDDFDYRDGVAFDSKGRPVAKDYDRFCCLGVATNIAVEDGVCRWGSSPSSTIVDPMGGDLPRPVLAWLLGRSPSSEECSAWEHISVMLIDFNDGNNSQKARTFKFIANWIEKNL